MNELYWKIGILATERTVTGPIGQYLSDEACCPEYLLTNQLISGTILPGGLMNTRIPQSPSTMHHIPGLFPEDRPAHRPTQEHYSDVNPFKEEDSPLEVTGGETRMANGGPQNLGGW